MQLPASRTVAAQARSGPAARPQSWARAAYPSLVIFACLLTYGVIAFGGLVRVTGAGLACPDWPMCNGRLLPTADRLVLLEWGHRFIAMVLGWVILAVAIGAWRWFRRDRAVLIPANLALVLVIVQALLGAATVRYNLRGEVVSAHLGTAMLVFAALLVTAAGVGGWPRTSAPATLRSFPALAFFGAMLTYGLMLTGSHVVATGAGGACRSWPLCDGLPGAGDLVRAQMFHRASVLLVGLVVAAILYQAWPHRRTTPALWWTALIALAIYCTQALIGAGNIWFGVVPAVQVAHIAAAAAMWATMVVLATLALRASRGGVPGVGYGVAGSGYAVSEQATPPLDTQHSALSTLDTLRAYAALTKPRIIELLLVTTVPAMVLAEQGMPPVWLIAVTVIGGTLSAGGANAINCYIDRDIDEVMRRTRGRPLPQGAIPPARALAFALVLEVAGFLLLAVFANLLAASLAVGATLFYVFVYTLWLKRRSVHNIVIGGAAGAVPPLVGWAAVTGRVEWPAVIMFAVVFFWTPAHFWALAIKYRDDYARAGVPMAPVVWSDHRTSREILLYAVVTALAALLLVPAGAAGSVYALGAALLGGVFVLYAYRLRRRTTQPVAMRLFAYSIVYLFLLFAVMVADQAARSSGLTG